MVEYNNKYTNMQLKQYDTEARMWSENYRNPVVGGFDDHNAWEDYSLLFTEIDNPSEKIAIDFACGPGRNLVKYKDLFKRLDGVDISPVNIEKAKSYTANNGITNINLYVDDLQDAKTEFYKILLEKVAKPRPGISYIYCVV